MNDEPTAPAPATLTEIADHIAQIIAAGSHNQTKAIIRSAHRPRQHHRTRPTHPRIPHPEPGHTTTNRHTRSRAHPTKTGSRTD